MRTTRRVELTSAGSLFLDRARPALAEIDGAIADAQRASLPDERLLSSGYGPFSRPVALAIGDELAPHDGELALRFDEGVTPRCCSGWRGTSSRPPW
jgi:DNA-binding transcriptional LysR family regulator